MGSCIILSIYLKYECEVLLETTLHKCVERVTREFETTIACV